MARIRKVGLRTHLIDELMDLYGSTLGFEIVEQDEGFFSFRAGATTFEFMQAEPDTEPFYHFAFNISENKIEAAREWQLERTPLMPIPESLQSRDHSEGIVNFASWNAHAMYFYDPAGNVVEYIARHDLRNARDGAFGIADVDCVSEIAFIVDDVAEDGNLIGAVAGVSDFRPGDDQFRALGDSDGLLLIMKRGRTLNFNPEDPGWRSRVFPTEVTVNAPAEEMLVFSEYPYEISGRLEKLPGGSAAY